jgi:protein-S-isoprenylcysteine O-methyltransferase Ste14
MMSLRFASVAAFALMVLGIVWMGATGQIVGRSVPIIAVQAGAVLLMIWARIAFGRRSFHAAANPTAGGLVTTGPYAFIRHPIYAAALYFVWAAAADYRTLPAVGGAVLVSVGAAARMYSEERLLLGMYPDYAAYSARTARVVPFLV